MKHILWLVALSLGLVACQAPGSAISPVVPSSSPASSGASPLPIVTPSPEASPNTVVTPPQPSTSPSASLSPTQPAPTPSPHNSPQPNISEPQIQANYVGQLFYQTDCISGQPNCSQDAYLNLWKSLGFSSADQNHFQTWFSLKSKYNISRPNGVTQPNLAEPLVFQTTNPWNNIRAASLTAPNLEQLENQLKPLMNDTDSQALVAILRHFSNKFLQNWWQTTGQPSTQQLLTAYQAAFKTYQLAPLIEEINRFYQGAPNPLANLQFHLILQAPHANISVAEQILNHGIVEVAAHNSPQSQLDVMVHEMTHYLFKQLSPQTQAQIQAFFASQPEAAAMSAYHLLDESLATAIGNGRVNERVLASSFFNTMLSQDNAFFNDAFIDLNGKALFQSRITEQPVTISSPAFLNSYYQTVKQTLNLDHPIPSLRLSALYLANDSLRAVVPEFQERLKPWSQFVIAGGNSGPTFLQSYPRLNGVLWFDNNLTGLEAWHELLGDDLIKRLQNQPQQPFIYGLQTPLRQLYIFKSGSDADHIRLMRLLFRQAENFSGFMFP